MADSSSSFPYNGSSCAYVNRADLPEQVRNIVQQQNCYIYPRTHAQFLVSIRLNDEVPRGFILLREASLINFELCDGEVEEWSIHMNEERSLRSITLEIRPLRNPKQKFSVSGKMVVKLLKSVLWRQVVTELERITFEFEGVDFFSRVTSVESEDLEEDEFTMPDIFRGIFDVDTDIYLMLDPSTNRELFELVDVFTKLDSPPRADVVNVTTNDEECFPVKKKLLQPCIALTSAVLSGRGVHKDASNDITVDVDCLTFDRVLLYLEHEAKGRGEEFSFDPEHTEELRKASITLGCSGLQTVCESKAGEFHSRVRKQAIRWEELLLKNASGEIWLIMDGMIFDVTRWLPEHPGGSVIIPREALNVDCTVMFEIYHSSRQSFRYLKQFYIGELAEEDKDKVPTPSCSPSEAFMDELRQFSTWRVHPEEKTHKSF